ncbi:DUF2306 domain-containing protein [Chitinophaga solisilvae]|uniref:DUF2306 domain-containing protein n=1 Tax=Chitinophaga solisilvae TaxID=1233460 RepID=UPI00136AD569|nr:DUF2306 domain-containing protein [Chitinophaga solisilvae]
MKLRTSLLLAVPVLLIIVVGLYPVIYLVIPRFGILTSKEPELLSGILWNAAFYLHILPGGLALLTGWWQFNRRMRARYLRTHRFIGKIYIIAVLCSAVAAIYLGFHANGGIIASLGFIGLGLVWFFTTVNAWSSIRKGNVWQHEKMMIYSYAACFAAVTLRLWLPLLEKLSGDFFTAYRLTAWLCWVPNLLVAWWLVKRAETRNTAAV